MKFSPFALTFIFSIAIPFLCSAQFDKENTHPYLKSKELKYKTDEFFNQIIGKDEEGNYLMMYRKKDDIYVSCLDTNLNVKRRVLSKRKHFKQFQFNLDDRIIKINEEFFYFYTFNDKDKHILHLYSQQLNQETLEFDYPYEMSEINYEGEVMGYMAGCYISYSSDFSKLLITTYIPGSALTAQLSFLVLDKNLEELWSKEVFKIEDGHNWNHLITDFHLGTDGKVYFMKSGESQSFKDEKLGIFHPSEIYVYDVNEEEPEVISCGLDTRNIEQAKLELLWNGDIQVVGFYSNKGKYQNGIFSLTYDHYSHNLIQKEMTPFSTPFIMQYASYMEKDNAAIRETNEKDVKVMPFKDIGLIKSGDSSVILIAEQAEFKINQQDAYYSFNNVLVAKLNNDGQVVWEVLIPKRQFLKNAEVYYSGFALIESSDGTLGFVFNDNPSNFLYESKGSPQKWKGNKKNTDLVLFTVSPEGQLKRKSLTHELDFNVLWEPNKGAQQVDEKELLLWGSNKKMLKLFLVNLP